MKKSDCQQNLLQQAAACALVIGSVALAGESDAATAAGTASATVLESVSITLSGTLFTPESFTGSLSLSGPLLRVGSAPPPGAVVTAAEGGTGAGAAPFAANSATVNVARKADGSLSVSGGSGLTFAVSQPGVGVVNIEYN